MRRAILLLAVAAAFLLPSFASRAAQARRQRSTLGRIAAAVDIARQVEEHGERLRRVQVIVECGDSPDQSRFLTICCSVSPMSAATRL